jgi:EAL domain-containing protein (putative c-di-GMP-specific phosphodiesterase class I)
LNGQDTTLVCFCIANLTTLRDVYGFDIQKVVFLALIDRIVAALEIKDFKFYKLDNGKLIVMPFNTTIIKTENFQRLISKTNLFEVTFKGVKLNLFIELYIVVVTGENKLLEKIDFSLNKLQTEMKNFYIFDKSDEDFIKEYENIMHRITNVSQALDNDRVVPYYQPVYRSGEILFNEVLLRIAQNNGNIYIPARFLEAVRNTSLYPHLTRNLFDKVIDISKESTLPFSINLMREDILNEELCDYIFNRIEVNKLGSLFIFELKVDDVFKNIANFSDFTRRAKIAGCKICLDDFGPGFINLRDFVRLKADFIKIDGSLIMALAGNKDVANTIKSIVNLSENLHITVIAQYVQNESLYYTLKDLGIECMQGFFLGKPQATPHR